MKTGPTPLEKANLQLVTLRDIVDSLESGICSSSELEEYKTELTYWEKEVERLKRPPSPGTQT
jgi:hypothetical protein